jgi:DNA-binding NarL/FixJ family response regulator
VARILIADDHESMRMTLRATVKLHSDWEVCGEATDGLEAVTKAEELQPDLIVLGFKMPIANGIKASSEIASSRPNVPILCTR